MKIINGKDYYDHIQNIFRDEKLHFVRKEEKIPYYQRLWSRSLIKDNKNYKVAPKCFEPLESLEHENIFKIKKDKDIYQIHIKPFALFIGGFIYKGIFLFSLKKNNTILFEAQKIKKNEDERPSFFNLSKLENIKPQIFYQKEDFKNFLENHKFPTNDVLFQKEKQNKIEEKFDFILVKNRLKNITRLYLDYKKTRAKDALIQWAIENKACILSPDLVRNSEETKDSIYILKNDDNLHYFSLPKIVETEQIYQDIETFLGLIETQRENSITKNVSNAEKIQKHGFNKFSFRKGKKNPQ